MRRPGIDERERWATMAALACVALIAGQATARADVGAWVALGLLLAALFLPVPSAWLVAGWKAVTHRVFRVVTSLLLAGVHLLVVTPIGLLRRSGRRESTGDSAFVETDEPGAGPTPASWDRPG